MYISLALLVLILISSFYNGYHLKNATEQINGCPLLIDTIYENCIEENSTTISTTRGLKSTLTANNGTCWIKTGG